MRTDELLQSAGFNNIRMARTYFEKENALLMEFIDKFYIDWINTFSIERNPPNPTASRELRKFLRMGMSASYGIDNEGNIIIVDPHC